MNQTAHNKLDSKLSATKQKTLSFYWTIPPKMDSEKKDLQL